MFVRGRPRAPGQARAPSVCCNAHASFPITCLLILLLAILNMVIMVINELNGKIAAVKKCCVIMVHYYYIKELVNSFHLQVMPLERI